MHDADSQWFMDTVIWCLVRTVQLPQECSDEAVGYSSCEPGPGHQERGQIFSQTTVVHRPADHLVSAWVLKLKNR